MSAFNADPELVDAYLALLRHEHNCNVRLPMRVFAALVMLTNVRRWIRIDMAKNG